MAETEGSELWREDARSNGAASSESRECGTPRESTPEAFPQRAHMTTEFHGLVVRECGHAHKLAPTNEARGRAAWPGATSSWSRDARNPPLRKCRDRSHIPLCGVEACAAHSAHHIESHHDPESLVLMYASSPYVPELWISSGQLHGGTGPNSTSAHGITRSGSASPGMSASAGRPSRSPKDTHPSLTSGCTGLTRRRRSSASSVWAPPTRQNCPTYGAT